ncbi:hypothetical protein FNW02_37285 [Komarekiella sp. 'clone 1']|uniref:Uncharacterized protein n=1 Tax=Komarekiella delphini-convector SJRDD-AB1 TaxID=2593771 RepID=A0AA40VVR8_9NOST|nr:hypothetical protein [Komarekiella delphini-convector]MBD6621202.1 hypothetical protein [Komarekiella delphini-convector SJRDD-AB1]
MFNKYLNICAGGLGVAAALIGSTILIKGTNEASVKSVLAGSWLLSGGSLLAATRLYQVKVDSDIEKILSERRKAMPKACKGCRNFHGVKYGGVMLVCGIHPGGVESDTCPDFEKFS